RDRIYWFWGDTERVSYPLGHFGTAGATSKMPGDGGLDPARGVNLDYFVDREGFSRPMCRWDEPGLKWISGLMLVRDLQNKERLLAFCESHKSLGEILARDLIVFNDRSNQFDRIVSWPTNAPLYPDN